MNFAIVHEAQDKIINLDFLFAIGWVAYIAIGMIVWKIQKWKREREPGWSAQTVSHTDNDSEVDLNFTKPQKRETQNVKSYSGVGGSRNHRTVYSRRSDPRNRHRRDPGQLH